MKTRKFVGWERGIKIHPVVRKILHPDSNINKNYPSIFHKQETSRFSWIRRLWNYVKVLLHREG